MFIVEDGSGVVNANSILSVHGADDILFYNGTWFEATQDEKERTLVEATMVFSLKIAPQLTGTLVNPDQELAYPRTGVTLTDGTQLPDGVVHLGVKRCIAELAVEILLNGNMIVNNRADDKLVAGKSVKIGPISITDTYSNSNLKDAKPSSYQRALIHVAKYADETNKDFAMSRHNSRVIKQ